MVQRIILDTDIGTDVDDAYALALLANSPEIKIEAVTTVWADAQLRALIARKLLNLLGKQNVPVAVGENLPLNRGRPAFLFGHEGRSVLEKDKGLSISDIPATQIIEALIKKYPNEIKILLIGPQTNLGRLLSEKPELAKFIKEFVVMGGTPYYGPKEIRRFGERPIDYNLVTDPESARIVFESGTPITMVGINVTTPTLLRKDKIHCVKKNGSSATDLLYAMTADWLKMINKDETSMHDPLAVTAAFNSNFLDTTMLNVVVETRGELTAGLTIVNRCDNGALNNVRVATDVRGDEFIEFMLGRILT